MEDFDLPLTAITQFGMYLLYLDESGTHAEASNFVLAGLAVFEREIHWYSRDLDALQLEYFPEADGPVHFHATNLRTGGGDFVAPPWDSLSPTRRHELRGRIYDVIRNRRGVLFGCVIEKAWADSRSEDPYERGFEDLISRFDMFISNRNREAIGQGGEEQRGMIVVAESSAQRAIRLLARRFQDGGTRWGNLHNVTDIPLFAPAKETRMLQYADFCSNAIYGRYQSALARDFDRIAPRFDQTDGIVHGLAHWTSDYSCLCLACSTRRTR